MYARVFKIGAHLAFWSVVVIGVLTAVRIVITSPMWSDDGTWFGAVAGFGALLLTIWIATSEARRRRREDLIRARLHATSIMGRLKYARSVALAGRDNMLMAQIGGFPVDAVRILLDRLLKISLWEADELVPIAPLAPNEIGLLGAASSDLKGAILALQHAPTDELPSSQENRRVLAEKLYTLFARSFDQIETGIVVCSRGLDALRSEVPCE